MVKWQISDDRWAIQGQHLALFGSQSYLGPSTLTGKESSIDDIDNRCLLNMLRRPEGTLGSFHRSGTFVVVVRLSNAIVVWGKTLAASGGTLGFLWSLLYWFDFSRYVINSQSLFWLASFTFACLLPIGASLVPNVRNRTRGLVIIGASLFVLPIWTYDHSYALDVLSVLLLFSWIGLLLVGGLILVFPPGQGKSEVSEPGRRS